MSDEKPIGWEIHAAAWLRNKAAEQERINLACPAHASVYDAWRLYPIAYRRLADELLRQPAESKAPPAPAAWRHFVGGRTVYSSMQPASMLNPEPLYAGTATGDDSRAFKNFHRALCERFGYVHNDKDWAEPDASDSRRLELESVGGKSLLFRFDPDGELVVIIEGDTSEQTDFILSVADLQRFRTWLASNQRGLIAVPAPLAWTDVQKPDEACPYTNVSAETPFGRLLITWKGWKEGNSPTLDDSPWGSTGYAGENVESAKRNVEAEFRRRLAMCFNANLKPACQHDLLLPDSTITVHEDGRSGRCTVCTAVWHLPKQAP